MPRCILLLGALTGSLLIYSRFRNRPFDALRRRYDPPYRTWAHSRISPELSRECCGQQAHHMVWVEIRHNARRITSAGPAARPLQVRAAARHAITCELLHLLAVRRSASCYWNPARVAKAPRCCPVTRGGVRVPRFKRVEQDHDHQRAPGIIRVVNERDCVPPRHLQRAGHRNSANAPASPRCTRATS